MLDLDVQHEAGCELLDHQNCGSDSVEDAEGAWEEWVCEQDYCREDCEAVRCTCHVGNLPPGAPHTRTSACIRGTCDACGTAPDATAKEEQP